MSSRRFQEADLRTLALARPEVTAGALDRYLAYQEALAESLERAAEPGRFAELHRTALAQSGLSATELTALDPLCRAFAGREVVRERVQRRIAEAEARQDLPRAEALRGELDRLSPDPLWESRYGADSLRLLRERRDRLVALHERIRRQELPPSPRAG